MAIDYAKRRAFRQAPPVESIHRAAAFVTRQNSARGARWRLDPDWRVLSIGRRTQRYAIEFPVPGVDERERIWRQGFPESVDTGDLDFRFLARQFAFSGGHIRSVIFNACLQAAAEPEGEPAEGKVGRPSMRQVLIQVRRELQKLNRSAGDDLFGVYARLLLEEAA